MRQQPDAGSYRACLGPRADVYVVVHLQVADAEVRNKEIDHFVEVLASSRVAKVELEPALFHDPLSVTREESLQRELLRYRAAHPDHLGLDP